ncbi:MAG: RrF2 family transcriptional regulator, partial [Planctomycetota bacterium]
EEYGLRCLVQLARDRSGDPLSAREIAAREGLTVEYVTQLLVKLRHAGLVRSIRGSRGGFLLTGDPARTTMGDVFRALGGTMLESLCSSYTGTLDACIHESDCGILGFWTDIAEQVHRVLDEHTLEDLARKIPADAARTDTSVEV